MTRYIFITYKKYTDVEVERESYYFESDSAAISMLHIMKLASPNYRISAWKKIDETSNEV